MGHGRVYFPGGAFICTDYLKVFAPRRAVGRLYLYTHPNGDYLKYELYLGSVIPEDANA